VTGFISIEVASEFDRIRYDDEADVLYVGRSDAGPAHQTVGTPEGHAVRYDEAGNVIGITLVNAKWLMERDGALTVTAQRG
jgi:YD repeat-containing protein